MATVLEIGQPQREVTPKDKKFTWEELKSIVGGWTYVISLGHGRGLVVDEDGLCKCLSKNEEASKILQEAFPTVKTVDIVGTAVLVTRKEYTW